VEFQDVVRRRRMVREFTDEPVSDESVRRIMRNALRGPSAGYSQGQAFLVLRGEETAAFYGSARKLWTSDTVKTAPVVVVAFAVKEAYLDRYAEPDKGWTDRSEDHWPVPFWHIDTGMAVLLILQTAVDEGLGAVAIGHGAEQGISEGASPRTRRRRPFEEAVHFGRW